MPLHVLCARRITNVQLAKQPKPPPWQQPKLQSQPQPWQSRSHSRSQRRSPSDCLRHAQPHPKRSNFTAHIPCHSRGQRYSIRLGSHASYNGGCVYMYMNNYRLLNYTSRLACLLQLQRHCETTLSCPGPFAPEFKLKVIAASFMTECGGRVNVGVGAETSDKFRGERERERSEVWHSRMLQAAESQTPRSQSPA